MKFGRVHTLSLGALLGYLLAGCSGDFATDEFPADRLKSVIRAVGYPCIEVVDSARLTDESRAWRVQCQDALAYTASLSNDGRICVVPMAYVDSVVAPGVSNRITTLDERCVSEGQVVRG